MASVTIGEGTIDNLMVSQAFQGRGYGTQALQFGVNKMLKQGYDKIRICYMEGNAYAENLYYSLGFKFLQNTHVYRKFL
jgi:ribosomal protein S18 acetylase RimI-like enzyme